MTNTLFDGLFNAAVPDKKLANLEGGRTYSYQDTLDQSARFANAIVALGVKPGDRVAMQVPKSIEAVMLYLACVRAGATFLPLNTAYTPGEIDYFLGNAGPHLFVCDPVRRDELRSVAEKNGVLLETLGVWKDDESSAGSLSDAALAASTEFKNIPCSKDDLAAILYTSGTTGRSKGAMLTHENLLSNAETLIELWHFSKDDVLLHALPIFHTHGLFVAINVVLLSGSSMNFVSGFNPDVMIENLPNSTAVMGVPTFYTRLLNDERFTRELVSHMRLFVSGSAPLLAETHIQFEERTGHRVLERYGMTETNMTTSNPYDGERRAGTVGFPLPGVSVKITDPDTGIPIAKGEIGMIEVKGPNVFTGYWQMPEKTAEEFRDDGFFITGDLGVLDDDDYITIVGRTKDLIISGGFNIYPKEIELILDELDGVLESAVIGVPHPDFGEAVVGVIVTPDSDGFDTAKLFEMLKPKISRFKQPKLLHVMDELPRNTMGKVQKNVLRELLKDCFI
ncbi:MAG: malonyl-CoA synthase [Rhizobiaceae bacterium]|nr:malonyl-CoA synthase [Rhizobiaceae bacterium]